MLILYALGSDSGFGLGTDGIIDDYDDETGISVILWCIIFLFLLIVTIWFYITQLMPARNAKCEVDDDAEDEDERVANRLLDQLGTKTIDKSSDEPSKCEPSTSREEDYEVIDGEIRIHYSNYERELTDDADNTTTDREARATIPRRPSMEEMSLIFPGFLPSISEEEEYEETFNEENVYQSGSDGCDTIESNVNIFIEHESSNEHNKSQTDQKQEKVIELKDSSETSRVVTNRKGKQPMGYVSTEIRRRHIQKDSTDLEIQLDNSTPREWNRDNASYVRDIELETAVLEATSQIKNTHEHEQNTHEFNNKTEENFISGDPINQTNTSGPKHDPNALIIIDESTVALETLSPDANENTNFNATDKETPSESSAFSSSFTANASKKELFIEEKSHGIEEDVKCEKVNDCESSSEVNGTVSSIGNKLEDAMDDQLTHSWTFYAMSDTNSNIENYLEDFNRTNDQQDIPQIVVGLYPDKNERDCNIVEHSNNNTLNSFETDIDVDDIDLDELDEDNNVDDLNCFVKRHISVTDLDKILTTHDSNDSEEQHSDDVNNEGDIDELVRTVTEPVHKTNKETTKELPKTTGDREIVNDLKQNSHTVLTGDVMYSYSPVISDQVSKGEDCTSKECEFFITKTSKTERNVSLANKEQHSINNDNVDNASKNYTVQSEVKFEGYSKRDLKNYDSDEKKQERITHVENYINTLNKDTNDYKTTFKQTTSIDSKQESTKSTKVEVKKGIYSYRSNADNGPDFEEHPTITEQEAKRKLSSTDSALSSIKNNEQKEKIFSCFKDTKIISDKSDKKETNGRASSKRSSIRTESTEKYVGLTAEELRTKVDLSKPVYTSSRDEVIIGRKKSRKDSGSRLFTNVTPGNDTELSRNVTPSNAMGLSRKSSETSRSKSEPSRTASKISRSKSEPSRSAVEQAVASRNAFRSSTINTESSLYSSRTSRSTSEQTITSCSTNEHSFVTNTSRNSVGQTETISSKQIKEYAVTSRIPAEQTDSHTNARADVNEPSVTQASSVTQSDAKNGIDKVTRTKDSTMNWTPKLASKLNKYCKIKDDNQIADVNSHFQVKKRTLQQQPTIKKTFVFFSETRELQTLFSIKDIPDSKIALQISSTTPVETTKTRRTSEGLEKAEEIVANRMKRIEDEKKNRKVHDNFSPILKSRQIHWDTFLIDGLLLEKVDNTREKPRDVLNDDTVLTPPVARKPIMKDKEAQVCESYTSQLFNPREIDWDWFEREDNSPYDDKSPLHGIRSKDNFTYDRNDNVKIETDFLVLSDCANREHNASKNENKNNCELDNNEDDVVVTNYTKDKDEHYSNDNTTAGATTTNDNTEEKLSTKHGSLSDDSDVFSFPSYPSSEPEFPVRLTKSFSELRNIEMLNQSRLVESNFQRPDRSKSQTDVFAPQVSQDDVFNDSEDHVFKTRITVDEVYKNRRRIVILNVRKKSPAKTRWKSLSDLESAKKTVFRFRSIGSHSELAEEKITTGDDLALFSENKDSNFTPSDKVSESLSRDCHQRNDGSIADTPSCKEAEKPIMENTKENCDSSLQSQPVDLHLKESTFKTVEQYLQEEDLSSKVTSGADVESTPYSSERIQLETVEPKISESVESQANVFQDDFILAKEKQPLCYRVNSPTESEVEMLQLQRQASLSPVQELTKQITENHRRSPGTIFALSRYSPTPLTDREVEKCVQRLPSPPMILPDLDKQDRQPVTSLMLSGTVNTVNKKMKDQSDNQQHMSEVKYSSESDQNADVATSQPSDYSLKTETVAIVSKDRPSPHKEPTTQKPLERQSSLSPVKDIKVRRSPSPMGTLFAVRGQSPSSSSLKNYNNEKPLSRQSSLSPVQDVNKKDSKYGTIFAVSRHSPNSLSDAERKTISEKITPPSPVQAVSKFNREDYNTAIEVTRKDAMKDTHNIDNTTQSRKIVSTNIQSGSEVLSTKRTVSQDNQANKNDDNRFMNSDYNKSIGSLYRNEKYKVDLPPQKSSPISPGLTETSTDYNSRHSSASSSGYGGSRISPSSSLERRYIYEKPSKPSLSPDLVPEGKKEFGSRRSSASSGSVFINRISPTPSTDSECSNIDDRRSSGRHRGQRGSYRSGTVFAISGYSSAASDSESKRPGSVSPREKERKGTTKHTTSKDRDIEVRHKTRDRDSIDQSSKYREIVPREHERPDEVPEELPVLNTSEKLEEISTASSVRTTDETPYIFQRLPSSQSVNGFKITQDGWLVKNEDSFPKTSKEMFRTEEVESNDRVKRTNDRVTDDQSSRANDHISEAPDRKVFVTDLDSLLNGPTAASTKHVVSDEQANLKEKEVHPEFTSRFQSRAATTISPTGVQETDLDAIFDSDSSSSKEEKQKEPQIPKNGETQRNQIVITSVVTTNEKHTVRVTQQDVADCNSTPSPMLDDLDEDIFRLNPKTRRDQNEATFSSDADSETSSLNSVPVKSKIRHTKASLEAVKPSPPRLSQSSDSSSATPSTPEKVESQFMFAHPDLTSTPEVIKASDITKYSTSLTRETAKEHSHEKRQDNNAKGNSLLTDSSYGAVQVKTRSTSDTRVISTEASKSAFTPVRSRTNDRRSISQEYIVDGLANQEEAAPNFSAIEESAFKDLADSHKSMPDLHKAHEDDDVVRSPKETVPYHSRLSAHTRLWLSQTAGIDTSDLCKDESGGSEIFLFPSKRFQPGKNVDASFLSIASEGEDIPDNVSSRASSPMSEFSFAGDSPFGTEADNELRIIACGHRYCDQEEIIRGQEKTSFTSCPACYTYYCSRECRQAHWREHKKVCYFGRINSYMRSFVYFCHKKDNLRLLLSNIAIKNYATKGRGSVMVTFASPKQARKFMTSGCVLLPSPPSYSTVRELMQEGVVSKHKVNLVHQVKDYDPTKEFVLNLAVVAGKLEDLPRNPVPRHKLNTVLECIKVPLSESVIEQRKSTVPDTSKETRVFYLPKCSRHGFINDMEARRHYCRNISKSLKSYGIRLKKDYPEAYECLCLYVEKNKSFKPLTVYGNEGSKIITCKIMPEASISAV